MGNIVSYIQENQRTFAESPFNPVDSLVFSTLCYFNYEACGLVDPSSPERVLLHDVVALADWRALTCASWLEDAKDTRAFLRVLMASRRFRDVKLAFYANERSDAVEKQFSATTFVVPGRVAAEAEGALYEGRACGARAGRGEFACLAFRGTDGSFAGWKEDFNLCFKEVIPSQRAAAAYLSGVASAVEGPLVACGHSKGGNLAEFAALVVDGGAYARLAGVYNHDGPSFLDDPSPRIHDGRFAALLHKTVPESSAFGMILERRPDYRVVQSSALSVFQHEPFSWQVDGDDFVYQEALNPSAVFFDDGGSAGLEAQGARGVSEVCPGNDDIRGGCGRHVRRRGPAFHPFEPDRLDACDGRLLARDLKDEGPPVGDVGCAHWQVALVCREPMGQVAVECSCGLRRWIYEHSVSLWNKSSS